MADGALASYIGMGVQALSSGLGGLFTNNTIKKENQKNRDWNEKMWNLTNQYNSPSNQRRLYEEAGLNPALLYGSNTNALASYSGNLGTSENFKNPAENVDFNKAVEGIRVDNEKKAIESNIEVNDSTIQRNASAARKDDADASNAAAQANLNLLQGQLLQAQMSDLIDKMSVDLENARKEGLIKDEDYKIRKEQLKQQGEILRRLTAEANTEEERTNTQKAETGLAHAKTVTEGTTQAANRAMVRYYNAAEVKAIEEALTESKSRDDLIQKLRNEAGLTWEEANKVVAETRKSVAETRKIEMETERDKYGTNTAVILNNHLETVVKGIKSATRSGIKSYRNFMEAPKRRRDAKRHYPGGSW